MHSNWKPNKATKSVWLGSPLQTAAVFRKRPRSVKLQHDFFTLDVWQPCQAKNIESFRQEVNGWFSSWYIFSVFCFCMCCISLWNFILLYWLQHKQMTKQFSLQISNWNEQNAGIFSIPDFCTIQTVGFIFSFLSSFFFFFYTATRETQFRQAKKTNSFVWLYCFL